MSWLLQIYWSATSLLVGTCSRVVRRRGIHRRHFDIAEVLQVVERSSILVELGSVVPGLPLLLLPKVLTRLREMDLAIAAKGMELVLVLILEGCFA